jgi:hypothetical protein
MLIVEVDAPSAFLFAVVVFIADGVRGTRRGVTTQDTIYCFGGTLALNLATG